MKIFISHAYQDKELAVGLSDLLDLGLGISQEDIFCSSSKGTLPNGSYFVQHILSRLNEADLIIALLSKAYFKSHFCMHETGVALARQQSGASKFYSFVVPPVAFSELDGALYGVQSRSILERSELGGLRAIVGELAGTAPKEQTWDEKREAFLKIATATVLGYGALESASRITLQDLILEHDDKATFKDKLRIVLRNDTKEGCEIRDSTWLSEADDLKLFQPLQFLPWQVKTHKGWDPVPHGETAIHIPADREFRTWISPDGVGEILKRAATRKLGSLILPLRFAGQDVIERVRL